MNNIVNILNKMTNPNQMNGAIYNATKIGGSFSISENSNDIINTTRQCLKA